jgi:hypothetical protein
MKGYCIISFESAVKINTVIPDIPVGAVLETHSAGISLSKTFENYVVVE